MKDIDFLPLSNHEARRWQRRRRDVLVAAVAVTVVLGGITAVRHRWAGAAQAGAAQPTVSGERTFWSLPAGVPVAGTPIDGLLEQIRQLEGKTVFIQSIVAESPRGNAEIRFRDQPAAGSSGGGEPAFGLADEPVRGRVSGFAPNDVEIGVLIGRLASCPRVHKVRLDRSAESRFNGRSMREFTITFDLLPRPQETERE